MGRFSQLIFRLRIPNLVENVDRRHLGIVASSYRTTHEVFLLGHINLSNFMVIGCIVLKIWGFEFFAEMA